jgi:hypothetical protein
MRLLSLLFTVVVSVVAFAQVPTITSFSPTQAEVGASVTITGTGFSTTANDNIVYFGGAKASVTNATATQLTVTVPNGSTRDFISVTKGGLTAFSRSNFNLFNSGTASIAGNYSLASPVTVTSVVTNTSLGFSSPGFDVIVGAADFDNDGWPDVFKSGNAVVGVNRNLLTNTAATIASNQFSAPSSFAVTGSVRTIVTADIDSDGKLDIITGSSTGISILRNTSTSGTISFAAAVNISTATTNVRVADFDLDGKLDIAAVNSGDLNIFKNTSTSSITFNNAVATALSTTGFTGIDIGDLNNDGKIDIVATKGGAINVIVNNSTSNSLSLSNSFTIAEGSDYVIVDDIDKDGKADIYFYSRFFKNNYSSGALASTHFTGYNNTNVNEGGLGISAPDINADGYPEIILGSWWSHFWIQRNAGTGVSTSIFSSKFTAPGTGGHAVGVDLNRDQKIDLIASNHGNNYSGNADFCIFQNTMTPTSVITVNNSMSTFNKCINAASTQQNFTVSGSGLQGNIVITPPAGFEISTTSGSGFGTTAITLTQTSGTVNSTTIYVRVPAANNTSTSGTLSLTSTGASTVNVSLASTMLADLVVTGSPSTSAQSLCIGGTATALTATATGPSVTYQWQSSTTSNGTYSNAVGGTGATTNTYTPPTTTAGTLYYRCYFNSSCGNTAGAASGAITVNANNTVGTASTTPTLCINTALTDITHATTGVTGIGTATGLPAGVTASFASNTITISGTPTASGTFNYTVPTTGGCGSVNATGTITVNALSTVGAASSSPNVCPNVAMTNVTHSTTGATGIGTATGLPTGLSASWASNTITISGTPTQSGTFNYSIPLTGGCGSATGTIIIKPVGTNFAVTSHPSTTNQVYCVNATATTLSMTGNEVNTYQWYSFDGTNGSGQTAIAGATSSTYTPPTNVIGTKYYKCYVAACNGWNTASQFSGAITTTDGSVWTGTVSTDPTNAGNWNSTCGSGNKIIIAGTPNSPEYTNLTIASGETFDIQEGAKVTVNGILSNSGTLNIKNNATLVQGASSTYVGTGTETVNVQQKITGGSSASAPSGRFWYLGSPVVNANATAFYSTSSSNVVKERDEPNNQWNVVTNSSSVALTPGKGYYVRASNGTTSSSNATSLSLTFTGNGLNNGAVTTPNLTSTGTSFTGFNLVSNPYPSYTDWTTVTKTNVGGTMWYRTHDGTNMNFGTVNASGVGTTVGSTILTKYIPPMQSFWVRVTNFGLVDHILYQQVDQLLD